MTFALALDTATEEVAVGVGSITAQAAHVVGEIDLDVPRASLTHLAPAIGRLLGSVGREMADIEAVVVGRGPGSFTGVRIGVASAKGIAHGLGTPLYGVGTLDAVAERFAARDGLVGIVGDAMRGEVYPALFRCRDGEVTRLSTHAVMTPRAAADLWSDQVREPVVLAGNGLRKYVDVFADALGDRGSIAPEALWTPTGGSLLAAAWRALRDGTAGEGDAALLLPVYTRLSDAEVNERSRAGLAPLPPDGTGVAGPGASG